MNLPSRAEIDTPQRRPRLSGVAWLEAVLGVLRSAAGSSVFPDRAARALAALLRLELGLVLLRHAAGWDVVGRCAARGRPLPPPSDDLLQRVLQSGGALCLSGGSLACPVLDERRQVVAALYGRRREGIYTLTPSQARVVQVLAAAVAAGLARQRHETESARLRLQIEHLLGRILDDPTRGEVDGEGEERIVTVLFCDIGGFTGLAEKIGPRLSCRLVGDVMDRVTARVREFAGVVVDYHGDGLLAMWNAPRRQPDHAALACRSALAIQTEVPGLSSQWREVLGRPLGLGIGINTGPALVGNSGSQCQFKYGPIGHTVNLAHRVEGAVKHFGVPVLLTGPTRAQLGDTFATRRLCRARVPGLCKAVDVYELHTEQADPEWLQRRDAYEAGLALFESGQWGATCRKIYPLLAGQEGKYDLSCLDLVSRAVACLKKPPEPFDSVLELPGK